MGLQSGQSRTGRCGWGKGKSSRTKIYCYKAAEKLCGLQWIDLKKSPENHSEVVLSNSDRNQRNCGLQFPVCSPLSFSYPIPTLDTVHNTGKTVVWKSIRLQPARGGWELPGPVMNWFGIAWSTWRRKGVRRCTRFWVQVTSWQLEPDHAHNSL